MKNNQKVYSILTITFSIITLIMVALYLFGFTISIDILMLFLGFTQLFAGLSQINMAQQMDSKGEPKGNKIAGGFCVILGIVIIIAFNIKKIL